MTPSIVVDIGNTRIKFALAAPCDEIDELDEARVARLPADDPAAWVEQLRKWGVTRVPVWQIASVHPARLERLREWIARRGEPVRVIGSFRQIPLALAVEFPERVGLDRLLNALAATETLPKGTPAVVADVGTAVTIDLLDEFHVFRGGAILPGPRLMFDSLHRHTALLPLIETHAIPTVEVPGTHTRHAMEAGVMAAQLGAVESLVREYAARCANPVWVFLTGGALGALAGYKFPGVACCRTDPLLTLRGIQLAAASLPSEGSP